MQSNGSVNGWKMVNEARFLGSWIKYEYHVTVKPTLRRVLRSMGTCFKREKIIEGWHEAVEGDRGETKEGDW